MNDKIRLCDRFFIYGLRMYIPLRIRDVGFCYYLLSGLKQSPYALSRTNAVVNACPISPVPPVIKTVAIR
jgi:hypothetical protein